MGASTARSDLIGACATRVQITAGPRLRYIITDDPRVNAQFSTRKAITNDCYSTHLNLLNHGWRVEQIGMMRPAARTGRVKSVARDPITKQRPGSVWHIAKHAHRLRAFISGLRLSTCETLRHLHLPKTSRHAWFRQLGKEMLIRGLFNQLKR